MPEFESGFFYWKVSNPLIPPLEQDASELAEEINNNPLTLNPVFRFEMDFDLQGDFTGISIYSLSSEPPQLSEYWRSQHWEIEFMGPVPIIDRRQNPYPINDEDQRNFED